MTPFLQSRVWFRRASNGERVGAVAVAVVAVALLAVLIVPARQDRSSTALSAGRSGGAPVGTASATPGGAASTDSGAASTSGDVAGGTVSAGATPGSTTSVRAGGGTSGAPCPSGSDQGVTGDQVKVAITIIDLAGPVGNSAFGVPSPQEQQLDWQQVADSINASGGAGCHQLSLQFFNVNPANPSATQQTCLDIADSKPFIVLDTGALSNTSADCLPAQQLPTVIAQTYATRAQVQKYFPYYLPEGDVMDDTLRNGMFALAQQGYFTNGFAKLGYLFQSCLAELAAAQRDAIRQAGVPDDKVVAYDLGCPNGGISNPADLQQAILKFKTSGVSHLTMGPGTGDFANFTKIAQTQGFKPQYVLAADAIAAVSSGANGPDPDNLDGAVNILATRYAEDTTPGFQPSSSTATCDAIFTAQGRPPTYEQGVGYGGLACSFLWFVEALLDHTPSLERAALFQGLPALGTFDPSFPYAPADFSSLEENGTWGRAQWRTAKYLKSCACWQVVDPDFHPPFQ